MLVELRAKVWWEERDLAHLSTRITNNNRALSIAMSSTPSAQKAGVGTMYTHESPTIMLWVIDSSGESHNVTTGVLGGNRMGEYYAEDFLPRAFKWLMEGT